MRTWELQDHGGRPLWFPFHSPVWAAIAQAGYEYGLGVACRVVETAEVSRHTKMGLIRGDLYKEPEFETFTLKNQKKS